MRLYRNVKLKLFYALPISHFINLSLALINNLLEMKVNVCNEKCITSWKPIGRADLSVADVSEHYTWKPASLDALQPCTKPQMSFTHAFNSWNSGIQDEMQTKTNALLYGYSKVLHKFLHIHIWCLYSTCCTFVISDTGRTSKRGFCKCL